MLQKIKVLSSQRYPIFPSFGLSVVKDQPDHVKRIAEFAIDAMAAASEVLVDEDDPESQTVEIRVGFHTGPVVADVVGTR